jgi:hypothetical protein
VGAIVREYFNRKGYKFFENKENGQIYIAGKMKGKQFVAHFLNKGIIKEFVMVSFPEKPRFTWYVGNDDWNRITFKFKENVLREILMFGNVWECNWNYYS